MTIKPFIHRPFCDFIGYYTFKFKITHIIWQTFPKQVNLLTILPHQKHLTLITQDAMVLIGMADELFYIFLQIWRQVLMCHAPEVCVVEEKQATNHACSNRGEDEHKPLLKQRRTWLGKSTFIEGCLHNTVNCDVIYHNVHYTVFHKE